MSGLSSLRVIAALGTLSCAASFHLAPRVEDQSAKEFIVAPTKARVYIFREHNWLFGSATVLPITVDGLSVGGNANGTYLAVEIAPGTHTILSQTGESLARVAIDASAGQIIFVEQRNHLGLLGPRVSLAQVDAARGKAGVLRGKLAARITLGTGSSQFAGDR